MTEADDLQAISEVLRGNRDAFRVIVDHHGGRMFRLAWSFLHSREEAEEASQEIFFKVFRSLRTFKLERPFLPWLYAIAVNHLRSRSVSIRRREERVSREEWRDPQAPPQSDPQVTVHESQAREEVRSALASLPSGLREVAALYYMEGMSVSEVAEALGISTENVKSRLLRGRRKLRISLGPDATGSG